MCNACCRAVSPLVVLTRHFDSDRTYSATVSGRQPGEPIPSVGLVGWSTFSGRASYVDLQGPRRGPVLPSDDTGAGTPAPLTSRFVGVPSACAALGLPSLLAVAAGTASWGHTLWERGGRGSRWCRWRAAEWPDAGVGEPQSETLVTRTPVWEANA
jgi:hypothetical protein